MCMCVHVYICMELYAWMPVCMCIHVYVNLAAIGTSVGHARLRLGCLSVGVCIYMYVYIISSMYIYLCIHNIKYVYISMYVKYQVWKVMRIHDCVCRSCGALASLYACICMCMYVCVCMRLYVCVHGICMLGDSDTTIYMHAYSFACMHVYVYIYIYIYIYIYTHTYMCTYIHA